MNNQAKFQAEKMADFFNIRAESYDKRMYQNVTDFEEFYSTIAKSIPATDDEVKILDLGCGTGLELNELFKRVPNALITGIDLSENMLVQLRKKYENRLAQIKLVHGSYLDFAFGENKFDYVISVMTVHHLLKENKLNLYEKIYRTLKKDGRYIEADYVVSEEKERRVLAQNSKFANFHKEETDGMYHVDIPMSIKTLHNLLYDVGFSNVTVIWYQMEAAILEAQI